MFVQHAEDPAPIICEGRWRGTLLTEARGENGFGYDPLFYVPEQQCTSAELAPELKNKISHRGLAMTQLMAAIGTMAAAFEGDN